MEVITGGKMPPATSLETCDATWLFDHLNLAVRAGHLDLLRRRRGRGLPVERAVHGLTHPGEPPGGTGGTMLRAGPAQFVAVGVESELELLMVRHILPFVTHHSTGEPWTLAVQG